MAMVTLTRWRLLDSRTKKAVMQPYGRSCEPDRAQRRVEIHAGIEPPKDTLLVARCRRRVIEVRAVDGVVRIHGKKLVVGNTELTRRLPDETRHSKELHEIPWQRVEHG